MGFYDCTCMLTGVSVVHGGATAVILRRTDGGYRPISLGVAGDYNGFGTIWSIVEDRNTELIYRYFAARSRAGNFVAEEFFDVDADDLNIEDLFLAIERTCSGWERYTFGYGPPSTLLDGDVIVYALVAQPVWDAIAESADTTPSPDRDVVKAFGAYPTPRDIYDGHLADVARQLHQLGAISEFVGRHGLRWSPPGEPRQRYSQNSYGQHTPEDCFDYIRTARQDYRGEPVMQSALDRCEAIAREWDV